MNVGPRVSLPSRAVAWPAVVPPPESMESSTLRLFPVEGSNDACQSFVARLAAKHVFDVPQSWV